MRRRTAPAHPGHAAHARTVVLTAARGQPADCSRDGTAHRCDHVVTVTPANIGKSGLVP
ncbi:hypothetical protein JCM9957A_41520 [Kineosporia succinea]